MKACRTQTFFIALVLILFINDCMSQVKTNKVVINTDSLQLSDSINSYTYGHKTQTTLNALLKKNKYINSEALVSLAVKQKTKIGKEFLFYLLALIIFLLALFKVFYAKYFNNIFRVFFNTSLRQNQLTDILLQSKLPSLIFNIFFAVSAGLYTWLLLNHYHIFKQSNNYIFLALSILLVGVIYIGKFLILKLIGWISGMETAIDQYIFVIFLINKITGILLIPFIILMAFAPANWLPMLILLSFCIIGIPFLLRYLRTYGLLQTQLNINRFHFLLYVLGIELLPLLIIYKLILRISL